MRLALQLDLFDSVIFLEFMLSNLLDFKGY